MLALSSNWQAHMCGWFFQGMRQARFYLGLKPPVRQENSDPSLLSLSEHFFQITAPLTTATSRRTRTTVMPMMGMEG